MNHHIAGTHPLSKGKIAINKRASKEYKPRSPYNREEDRLRPLIIQALRKRGFKVYRVEPFTRGYSGMGDLWCMRMNGSMACWVEIKTNTGVQSEDQKMFQELCESNLIKYLIIRTPQEASQL